jgi:hypothetical protein
MVFLSSDSNNTHHSAQLDVRTATNSIRPLLKASIKAGTDKDAVPNWRIRNGHFSKGNGDQACEPGAINFSAGWFGQGHEVSPTSSWE